MSTKPPIAKEDGNNESPRHRGPGRRRHLKRLLVATGIIVLAVVGITIGLTTLHSGKSHAAQITCGTSPSSCGFPDASNTGVPSGTTLKTVGTGAGQVSSGTGWSYNSGGWVAVTGNGANLSGLNIPYGVVISANNVTLNNDNIVTGGANAIGVSLRHTSGVTIQNTTIAGVDSGTNRVTTGIKDIFSDSTGLTVNHDNISLFETGVQLESGLVENNYIHDPGFIAGDHTNGVMSNGGSLPLTITHNTIFNNRTQTDDVGLFEDFSPQSNRTVSNNLLAGGGYCIYGGNTKTANGPTSNIVITGNVIATNYFANGGANGPVAYFNSSGQGNSFKNNTWDTTGNTVNAP
ncbi:MAG TPA: hypothetical protein VFI65_31000 [Streptosporangiaceae bacterium]|nr:hypothetical protein [Streptosporangiaceae bacterium]